MLLRKTGAFCIWKQLYQVFSTAKGMSWEKCEKGEMCICLLCKTKISL